VLLQNRTGKLEEMASGSFNIDTFSYRRQLPLSNEYTAFSTGTMFAVGPSSFLQGYSFYDYSYGLCGFPDTSTMSVNITNLISAQSVSITRLISTTFSTTMNNFSNIRSYLSTDATFTRCFQHTCPAISTFQSSSSVSVGDYPLVIDGPTINLQDEQFDATRSLYDMINARTHDLVVQFSYSIVLNKAGEDFNWVSTLGFFNTFDPVISARHRQYLTRVGVNSNYTTLTPSFYFNNDDTIQIPLNPTTFGVKFVMTSNTPSSSASPSFSIYVPGEYNYSFTFYPFSNYVSIAPPALTTQNIR
jgi:hypothetical protein